MLKNCGCDPFDSTYELLNEEPDLKAKVIAVRDCYKYIAITIEKYFEESKYTKDEIEYKLTQIGYNICDRFKELVADGSCIKQAMELIKKVEVEK